MITASATDHRTRALSWVLCHVLCLLNSIFSNHNSSRLRTTIMLILQMRRQEVSYPWPPSWPVVDRGPEDSRMDVLGISPPHQREGAPNSVSVLFCVCCINCNIAHTELLSFMVLWSQQRQHQSGVERSQDLQEDGSGLEFQLHHHQSVIHHSLTWIPNLRTHPFPAHRMHVEFPGDAGVISSKALRGVP